MHLKLVALQHALQHCALPVQGPPPFCKQVAPTWAGAGAAMSQIKTTQNNTLVCDSYNANPTSMILAIRSFFELKANKKVLILGDMLELGEKGEEEHIKVLSLIEQLKPEKVLLVGDNFPKVSARFGFKSFRDNGKLRDYLKTNPVKGSLILIKGSRRMALEMIYDLL